MNWFRSKGLSSGVVEGFNNKVKLTVRKGYGFRTFEALETALFHALGRLPEPKFAHRFWWNSLFYSRALLPVAKLRHICYTTPIYNFLPQYTLSRISTECSIRDRMSKQKPIDQNRIVAAVREILLAIGENPDREGLRETPHRVARMYQELFSGLHDDPTAHTKKFFSENYNEIVLLRDISFNSVCEHHLMPFMGKIHIGYIPDGRVIGLSKLARVIEVFSHRPQVQERLTEEIAELLYKELKARAVAVVVEAEHTCMTVRGVKKPGSLCITSALRGSFLKNPSSRAEIMTLINKR